MKLDSSLLNSDFSHIYIEKSVLKHYKTKKIIKYFNKSKIIEIDHYKDIFSRTNQSFKHQKNSKKLILAQKKDNFVYNGSEMCDDFGNENFYYTSDIMNCIYNCEYCYLQGMYTSANIVVFVNIEDTIRKVREISKSKKIYLCISYDSDILALENIARFTEDWYNEAVNNKNITIELRTKSANFKSISNIIPVDNFILAWTLSPEFITRNFEGGTPSLNNRLNSVKQAVEKGWKIRLCIDPILYIKDFEKYYDEMISTIFNKIDSNKINDISIGTFRVGKELYKNMKYKNKKSYLLAYPFVDKEGYVCYTEKHRKQLIEFVNQTLKKYIDSKKIFIY